MATNFSWLSILCGRDVRLQSRAALDRSENVSMVVHNISWDLFHIMGRVSGIATRYSLLTDEGGNNPSFGTYPCCRSIQ